MPQRRASLMAAAATPSITVFAQFGAYLTCQLKNPLRDGAREQRHASNNFDSAACRSIRESSAGEQQGSVCSDRMTVPHRTVTTLTSIYGMWRVRASRLPRPATRPGRGPLTVCSSGPSAVTVGLISHRAAIGTEAVGIGLPSDISPIHTPPQVAARLMATIRFTSLANLVGGHLLVNESF